MDIYHSLQNLPYAATEEMAHIFLQRSEHLRSQADAWESMGFFSNAKYWREEATISELDNYRLMVCLGKCEEDEDIEEEIEGLVAKWEGTTIAR